MEEDSIVDINNFSMGAFSHTSNTQRENANTVFTSEKLYKLDKLADAVNDVTITNAEYYK